MSSGDSKKAKRRKSKKVDCAATEVAKVAKSKEIFTASPMKQFTEPIEDSVYNSTLSRTLNPYMGDDRCLLCRRQRTASSTNDLSCEELGVVPCDLSELPPNPLWVCTECQRSVEDDQRWDSLDLRRIPADLLLQAANVDLPCVSTVKTVISETNSSSSSCSCETCLERREMEAEQERDTEQSHIWWMELRHAIRHFYQESGVSSGGEKDAASLPQLDTLKDLVHRLILRDPHQLFLRLESQLREFVIEIKLDLLKHLAASGSSPQHAQEFISIMMDHYANLCAAAKKATPALKQLETEHLKRFNLSWDLMNRCLFQIHVYADHRIQNILPGVITQLRVGSASVDYGNEVAACPFHQYLKLENEMPVIAMIWRDAEQLIEEFKDEQATLKAKQRMLKEDWEIFRAHRKLMLEQQVLKKSGTQLHRCPCDECSLSHMLACGVLTPLDASPQSPVPTDSVDLGIAPGAFSYDCPTQYLPPSFLSSVVNNLEILDDSLSASNGVAANKECSFLSDAMGSGSNSSESTSDGETRNQFAAPGSRRRNFCINVPQPLECSSSVGRVAKVAVDTRGGSEGDAGTACRCVDQCVEIICQSSSTGGGATHICQCQGCTQSQTVSANLRNGSSSETLTAQENKPEERPCECHACVQHGDRALPSPVMVPPKPAALHLYPHIHGLNSGLNHSGLHMANPRLYGVHFPLPTRSKHALLAELDAHPSHFQDHFCHTYLDLDNAYDSAKLLLSPRKYSAGHAGDIYTAVPSSVLSNSSACNSSAAFCQSEVALSHIQDALGGPDQMPDSSPASPVERNCPSENELHACMRNSPGHNQNVGESSVPGLEDTGVTNLAKRCAVASDVNEATFAPTRTPADGETLNGVSDGSSSGLTLHSASRGNCNLNDARPPMDLPQFPQTCPVLGSSDGCHGGDHDECGLDDSCSEQSSSTSTSNQKSNKHCDCCYCDLFGHDASSLTTANRNFTETRERLRLRLTKRKNNAVESASLNKVMPMEDCRDLDVLLNFINGSSNDDQQQLRNKATAAAAAKKPRHKQKKAETKSHHMLELAKILAKTDLDDDDDDDESAEEDSYVEELLKTAIIKKVNLALPAKTEPKSHSPQQKGKCKANEPVKGDDAKCEGGKSQPQVQTQSAKLPAKKYDEVLPKRHLSSKTTGAKSQPEKVIGTKVVKQKQQVEVVNEDLTNGKNLASQTTVRNCNSAKKISNSSEESAKVDVGFDSQKLVKQVKRRNSPQRQTYVATDTVKNTMNGKSKKSPLKSMVVSNSGQVKPTKVVGNNVKDGYKAADNLYNNGQQLHNGEVQTKSNHTLPDILTDKADSKGSHNVESAIFCNKSNSKQEKDNKMRRDEKVKIFVRSSVNDTNEQSSMKMRREAATKKPGEDMNSIDDVFLPRDIDLDDGNLDETERELEAFKRFCWNSVPVAKKERVQVNLKDIIVKKKAGDL